MYKICLVLAFNNLFQLINVGSHRTHKGSDFSSSSDEEYQMSAVATKSKRSSHTSGSTPSQRGYRTTEARSKSVSHETEEEEDQNDVDPYQNWSTHSAEIAK